MKIGKLISLLFVVVAATAASECNIALTPTVHGALPRNQSPSINSAAHIQHIVVIVQENRSFDNLFNGYPGADTVQSGLVQGGASVPLLPVSLEAGIDIGHFHSSFVSAYDSGLLDDFDIEGAYAFSGGAYVPIAEPYANYPYAYVPQAEVAPYFSLAAQFTLGDRMFQSNTGPSFVAHQYLIAGQSNRMVEVPNAQPWGCDAPVGTTVPVLGSNGREQTGPFPCQNYITLADELDAKGVSWKYYAPGVGTSAYIWSAFDAVRHIRFGPDWMTHIISPETSVFNDISSGTLPQMSWVIPSLANSDHAISGSNTGPLWVASIVNAIGSSPYWNSTAIIIVWDDWGGWYDHVAPPHRDSMGDGFRVPLLVVSPYAKHGYISHTPRDFGSVLRFAEDTFGLPRMGVNDITTDSFNDCFDFTQTPKPLQPIMTRLDRRFFMNQKRSLEPPDED